MQFAQQAVGCDLSNSSDVLKALEQLNLDPTSVIVLLGDVEVPFQEKVYDVCKWCIAPVARELKALVLDDGQESEPAISMGRLVAEGEPVPQLLAVLSIASNQVEKNHPKLLKASDTLPDRTSLILEAANAIGSTMCSVKVVLFGGKASHRSALLRAARKGWPVVVVSGTGGLAGEIVTEVERENTGQSSLGDAELRDLLDTALISVLTQDAKGDDLWRILHHWTDVQNDIVPHAWALYEELKRTAEWQEHAFRQSQNRVLILGILASVVAVCMTDAAMPPWMEALLSPGLIQLQRQYLPTYRTWLHLVALALPATIAALLEHNRRFRQGHKWILLRRAAGALKREVYSYQLRVGPYSDVRCDRTSREKKLAGKVQEITADLAGSEANRVGLDSKTVGSVAPKISTPAEYLAGRVEEQAFSYSVDTRNLYSQMRAFSFWAGAIGVLGSLLAAIRLDVWIAVTSSISLALTLKIESEQTQDNLIRANQALTGLRNVGLWWRALNMWERRRKSNIEHLVDQTERTIQGELVGWFEQMQSTFDAATDKSELRSLPSPHPTARNETLSPRRE